MGEPALRQQLCEMARRLYDRGHNAPADGNLSVRLGDRYLLCTPSGGHKGQLRAADIVKIARDGRAVDRTQRASSEARMHRAIYDARPDVQAIIHAHSPTAVGLTVAGVALTEPVVPEIILALGAVPTVPYTSPTTEALATSVVPTAREHDAFILERHGSVALGHDLEEAFRHIEVVEHTAKITLAAITAGRAQPLPAAEIAHLRAMRKQG